MERQFMVKPQGLLRKEFECHIASDKGSIASEDLQELIADTNNHTITSWVQGVEPASHENADTAGPARRVDRGPHPGDISLDSAGGMKGAYGIPDFVVVKATETLHDDTIIAIVEVKVKDDVDTYNQAFIQITNYLAFAVSKQRDPNLKGYLLMADTVHVWGFDSPAPDADWIELSSYPMDLDRLKQELYDIAGTHWDI
ncbi:hypothetical protein LshimejAT787_0600930 [Lyophyllum shimeji]|uniref:Uncharacterized protein n=1 Tax=Lyophyllum shimeji TaxID=47721 RepID=A0A9P3PNL4_LYOSH|nr:hypothetical protein LshimejAT787_0600930 [Lyophyllum shimeji]